MSWFITDNKPLCLGGRLIESGLYENKPILFKGGRNENQSVYFEGGIFSNLYKMFRGGNHYFLSLFFDAACEIIENTPNVYITNSI